MDEPVFEVAELEGRVARARERMREHRLDALLVTAPPNFRYFTGFESYFWESPTRPWYLVIPADLPCRLVVPAIGVPALATHWIADIRSWPAPRPGDDGVSLLAETLRSLPRRFGRLGLEMGRESSLRMPLIDLFAVRDRLTGIDLVDGSPCFWEVRRIKSPAEVGYIRESCRLVSDAFEDLAGRPTGGRSERDVCRDLTIDILRRGAHAVPFIAAASGPGGYPEIISAPGTRILHDGDLLIIDVGATIHGYFCDFDRNYGIGRPSDAALRAHDAVWRATEAGIRAARPGATTTDLWTAMMKVLEPTGSVRNNVGRLGHGLGLQLTEPPSIMPGDDTAIVPGMVITIEPGIEYADGRMIVHEEDVVITEDGAELLTRRAPRELPIGGEGRA